MAASLRFTDKRLQAIYDAMMSSKSAAEFGALLEDALKTLEQDTPPEQAGDRRFRRGKAEYRCPKE